MSKNDWAGLLHEAVTVPGVVSTAYHAFHNYSMGNQMLASMECRMRGLPLGPIATFNGWKAKGRFVKRGERAITLWMPLSYTKKDKDGNDVAVHYFALKPHWFTISQTDGKPYAEPAIPGWDIDKALAALNIERVPYDMVDGNTQAFAQKNQVAINPVAAHPAKSLLHEIAHVLLGHTDPSCALDKHLKEAQAESVALLVADALDIPGADESRGYIQSWFGTDHDLPVDAAQDVFMAADKILKAGR